MLKQIISTVIVFTLLFNIASAIERPSVGITKYDSEIFQGPGTTKTYQVEVQNTGDVPSDSVYLTLFFLPSSWYKFEGGVRLEINEKKVLNYSLSIPSDASGSISYNLTANAIRGFGIVSNPKVPVVLKIQKEATETSTAQATTTSQTTSTTTQMAETTSETAVQPSMKFFDSRFNLIILVLIISVVITLMLYKFV